MWPRLETYMNFWGLAMLGAWVSRLNRNVWPFLYPVCFNEQDLCTVQRCQTCLGSHKQLQNSACAYTWAYACMQTEKPGCGIQERLMINRQHWHAWGHRNAVPHQGPILPRKQNIYMLEKTDLIIYTIICDSSDQMSPQRIDVLKQDCLFGSAVREKTFLETSEEEDPGN